MNDPSPYRSPQSVPLAQPPPGVVPDLQPSSVKVFGIMHIVFAILGLLMALWSVVQQLLFTRIFPRDPVQLALHERTGWITWVGLPITLVVAWLMLTAGIRLTKATPDALRWSNRYAWTSIAGKILMLTLTVAFILPAMIETMREQLGRSVSSLPGGGESMIITMAVVGALLGGVVTFLYPTLTLVMLNRPAVKGWFARRGGGAV